jgi:hypothetical protein
VGSTEPASISVALDAAFTELGYANEDGVKFTDGKTLQPIRVWQEFYEVRNIVTEREARVAFSLVQWNPDTVTLAFGGGTVTEDVADTEFKYEPPDPEDVDERAAAVEWVDGTRNYRLIVPKCQVVENVETDLVRTGASLLPITLGVLGVSGAKPWYLQTDDPAFDLP